jgi:hypothetical protein
MLFSFVCVSVFYYAVLFMPSVAYFLSFLMLNVDKLIVDMLSVFHAECRAFIIMLSVHVGNVVM